jgi:predicted MFS family arabinose efflux permease
MPKGAAVAPIRPNSGSLCAVAEDQRPVDRAPIVGVYRFWHDSGYAFGGLIAGVVADALGYGGAIAIVAGLTAASGLWVLVDMPAPAPPTTTVPTQVDAAREHASSSKASLSPRP